MTTSPKAEYRIETRHGYYSAYERIAGYEFPAKFNASFQGATTYDVRPRAEKVMAALRRAGHSVNLHAVAVS